MLKSSCIRSMACFFLRIELPWLSEPRLQWKQRFIATNMLDDICTCETGIISDGRTDGYTNRCLDNYPRHSSGAGL